MNNSRKGSKNKVRPGYGIRDYYKYYCNKYSSENHQIEYKKYKSIIDEFNQTILELIIYENLEFTIPYRLGALALRKLKPTVEEKNGVIINKNPINIKATMDLWDINEEAREKKVKIRFTNKHTKGYVFFLHYFKGPANYKNKSVYQFIEFRKVKQQINKAVTEYNIDTYII